MEKDESKVPGGFAFGKASAERPREERVESAQKAAQTRRDEMVGAGKTAAGEQPQPYEAELRGNTWKVEREVSS